MGANGSSLMVDYYKKMIKEPYMPQSKQKELLKKVFNAIDKDNNGYIEGQELAGLAKALSKGIEEVRNSPLSDAEFRKIKSQADKNKDGKLDFNEFCEMIFAIRKSDILR